MNPKKPVYVTNLKRRFHNMIRPQLYSQQANNIALRQHFTVTRNVMAIEDSIGPNRPGNWKISDIAVIADSLGMVAEITFRPKQPGDEIEVALEWGDDE